MLSLRNQLSEKEVITKSQAMVKIIKDLDIYKKSKTIGLYYPMRNELDLRGLLNDSDKTFYFPKVIGDQLAFYQVDAKTTWMKSAFGVLEPKDAYKMDQTIEILIVPALAISHNNHRVGYGKGFYDRYIKDHHKTYAIGVIYAFQEIKDIDSEAHDQRLDTYIKI